MCELLVKAADSDTSPDPEMQRGRYLRGMFVVIMPDGHPWGAAEGLPKFAIIKFPGVSVERAQKYIEEDLDPLFTDGRLRRRRVWQLRWADLPNAARNKLANSGQLVIAAGDYSGTRDYTWAQVRQYFRNLVTGQDETGEI